MSNSNGACPEGTGHDYVNVARADRVLIVCRKCGHNFTIQDYNTAKQENR